MKKWKIFYENEEPISRHVIKKRQTKKDIKIKYLKTQTDTILLIL